MFYRAGHIIRSDILDKELASHGFATRSGGVSSVPETASMNTAVRMGDTAENVSRNIELLAEYAGLKGAPVIYSRQVHMANVLRVTPEDAKTAPESREWDAYVTIHRRIALLVRAADCVPILFSGRTDGGAPVIGAAHAGWKGTVKRIASAVVEEMCLLGAVKESIRVAVGPSIRDCCFEVKEDFIEAVTAEAGADFKNRHICQREGRYYASLQGMNTEILIDAGITEDRIDVCGDCTAHMNDVYHSHRATGGRRGTGGGIIGITAEETK